MLNPLPGGEAAEGFLLQARCTRSHHLVRRRQRKDVNASTCRRPRLYKWTLGANVVDAIIVLLQFVFLLLLFSTVIIFIIITVVLYQLLRFLLLVSLLLLMLLL